MANLPPPSNNDPYTYQLFNALNNVSGVTYTVSQGGTGVSSVTPYSLIAGGTSSTANLQSVANSSTVGSMLYSQGTSIVPAWTTAAYPTTTTINQLLYSSSNNNITGLTTANNSTLVTNGSGVPSWSTSTSVGTCVKISQNTLNNVASLVLSGLTTTYSQYLIVLSGVVPATAGAALRFTINADATAGDYAYAGNVISSAGTNAPYGSYGANAFIQITDAAVGNTSTFGVSGTINLMNPNNASSLLSGVFNTSYVSNAATTFKSVNGGFNYLASNAVTSITIAYSSGNLSSGTVELYGFVA